MSGRFLFRMSCALLSAALLHAPAVAQGNSQGHGHGNPHNQDRNQGGVQISFSVHDQNLIRGYYQDHRSNLPPGLAKRGGNLPPGLQKHLERDGTLPPGLQKRIQPFPEDLEARLPRLPVDYHRVILGADIMILDRRTQKIIDIVHDILTL